MENPGWFRAGAQVCDDFAVSGERPEKVADILL